MKKIVYAALARTAVDLRRAGRLSLIAAAMTQLRARPPVTLAGQPVTVLDLAAGGVGLPPTDGILITGASLKVVVLLLGGLQLGRPDVLDGLDDAAVGLGAL